MPAKGVKSRMGRPKGSGLPPEMVRTERVVVMLTPGEREKLARLAEERDLPIGTAAYELVARALRRAAGRRA